MLTRRHLLAAPAAAALGTALARPALAKGPSQVLKFVPAAAYSSPDPVWTTAIVVAIHALMVWDTPYGADMSLTPKPQMCEGHEVSDDGLTWTFKLRDGLMFHDGERVLGRDVAASIKRWGQRDVFGQRLLAIAHEVDAPSDKTFRIRLKEPFPQMLYALGAQNCFVMPERMALTPANKPITEFVGSGPFRFVADEFVSGVRAVYARNDKYVPRQEAPENTAGGKVVHFEQVEWVIQPDPGTAANALVAGEVDWVDQPLFDLLPVLEQAPDVTLAEAYPFGLIGTIILNHTQPPFDNKKLRQALLHAVDQKEYIAAVLGEQARYGKIPVGYFTVGSPSASDAGMEALTSPRDLDRARKLVAESGYNGEPILLMSPSDQPQMHAMAAVSDSLFKKLGMNSNLVAVDWGTLLSRRSLKKPAAEGGWNAFNTRLAGGGASNPTSIALRGSGPKAWFGWPEIPELERLREAWFKAPTLAEQKEIARQMQLAAFEGVPYIPLGQWSQPTAHRKDLTGIVRGLNHVFWGVRRV